MLQKSYFFSFFHFFLYFFDTAGMADSDAHVIRWELDNVSSITDRRAESDDFEAGGFVWWEKHFHSWHCYIWFSILFDDLDGMVIKVYFIDFSIT